MVNFALKVPQPDRIAADGCAMVQSHGWSGDVADEVVKEECNELKRGSGIRKKSARTVSCAVNLPEIVWQFLTRPRNRLAEDRYTHF